MRGAERGSELGSADLVLEEGSPVTACVRGEGRMAKGRNRQKKISPASWRGGGRPSKTERPPWKKGIEQGLEYGV